MYGKVQLISRLSIKPQKHKMVKKDVWLEEAHIRFFEQGITGINIEDISKTIGVAKTSFYHFFNKLDIKSMAELVRITEQMGIKPIE